MELKVDAEIILKPQDLEEIIRLHVKEYLGRNVSEIRFEIDPGHDERMSYKAPRLKRAVAKVKL